MAEYTRWTKDDLVKRIKKLEAELKQASGQAVETPAAAPATEDGGQDAAPARNLAAKSKKKPKGGKPGNFHGARREYLESCLPAFLELPDSKGKRSAHAKFWINVTNGYWQQFPWWIPREEDPVTSTRTEPTEAEMTDELTAQKADIIKTKEKVRARF